MVLMNQNHRKPNWPENDINNETLLHKAFKFYENKMKMYYTTQVNCYKFEN